MNRRVFEQLVGDALATIPKRFRRAMQNLAIVVEDEPSPDVLEEMEIEPPDTLLGLYQGVPLADRDTFYQAAMPDRVLIYRGPIVRSCDNRRQVIREIRDTVIHELVHHFGLDEEDMPY